MHADALHDDACGLPACCKAGRQCHKHDRYRRCRNFTFSYLCGAQISTRVCRCVMVVGRNWSHAQLAYAAALPHAISKHSSTPLLNTSSFRTGQAALQQVGHAAFITVGSVSVPGSLCSCS